MKHKCIEMMALYGIQFPVIYVVTPLQPPYFSFILTHTYTIRISKVDLKW